MTATVSPLADVASADLSSTVDIGIVTIRDDEFRAVLAAFPEKLANLQRASRAYTLRHADAGGRERYRIAVLRLVEQGQGEAQDAARDLIDDLGPRLVLVVGIAGGRPSEDVKLGDVVISTRIHDFTVEARKADEAPTYALTGGPVDKALAALIANLAAREDELGDWTAELPKQPPVIWTKEGQLYGPADWQRQLRDALEHHYGTETTAHAPAYAAGPIASSDRLVKDPELLIPWLQTARNLLAIEMESGGVYRAARERCPMLAIRGISDIVGLKRTDGWTKYACASAAAFTRAFLRTRPIELRPAASGAADSLPTAGLRPDRPAPLPTGTPPAAPLSASLTPSPIETPLAPRLETEAKLARVTWRVCARLNQSLMARRGELLNALEKSGVVLRFDLPRGTDRPSWPTCFNGKASVEDDPRAFVWTGHSTDFGDDLIRLFDDGTIVFERRLRPPAQRDENVVVDFDLLALDTLAFVRLSSATYARAAKSAGTSVAAPYTVELTLELPKDHRRIVALFRGPEAIVRPRELMRTAYIKKPRVVVSRQVPVSAAERLDAVSDALVGLLGGVADEFDLEINEVFSSGARVLQLDEKSLREFVPYVLRK